MSDDIEKYAIQEAKSVLQYFKNIDMLGSFCNEPTDQQKLTFLRCTLINFARRALEKEK